MPETLLYCVLETPSVWRENDLKLSAPPECAPLAAVTAPITALSSDTADLVAYSEILVRLHQIYNLVPMRYGSVFPDCAAVQDWLRRNAETYRALLSRLDGCSEIGVRILLPAPPATPPAPADSGLAYLQARRRAYAAEAEQLAQGQACAETLRAALAPWTRELREEQRDNLLSLYFLVPRETVSLCRGNVAAIQGRAPCAELLFSGPWPPFNFVAEAKQQSV